MSGNTVPFENEPWLTIIGFGEDGPDGLSPASCLVLENAEIVMAPPRHLSLLGNALAAKAEKITWPIPFANGINRLLALRGRQVVVLASGDPFWFGAGSTITRHLLSQEWQSIPNISSFSLAANRLGWPLEDVHCLGLHAVSLTRLRPYLAVGNKIIALLRDVQSVSQLAAYLVEIGFGTSRLWVLSALGGAREIIYETYANAYSSEQATHPLCLGIEVAGGGEILPCNTGIADSFFETDGVMTKQPVRALTLSALAPKAGERLWDIGGGSGSIAIEWLLAHPNCQAITIEPKPERIALIKANAIALGADRLQVAEGHAPAVLTGFLTNALPDAVFIGGGLSTELIGWLAQHLPKGTRIVANAVTLETEALLVAMQAQFGGELMCIELSHTSSLGNSKHQSWKASYPVVQWSVVL